MEFINFNDFSVQERHEIISAFLIKMREANSMESAHRFFEYYLKQFYKMPAELIDDIIYCQRAMKTYLSVHKKITNFFGRKTEDLQSMDRHLLEIEDIVHEINAECQYLVLCLEEDIERFCLPFTEQQLQPNGNLINVMVSQAVVPHVSASVLLFKPHFVAERPTESQLWRKYFTNNTNIATATTTNITANTNSGSNSSTINSRKDTKTALNAKDESPKPTRIVAPNKKPLATRATIAARPPQAAKRATAPNPMSKRIASKNEDAVNASRLHLQEVLKRARLNQNSKCEPKAENSKESFLHSFGLCTHLEHKSMMIYRSLSQKRRPKVTQKFSSSKGFV